MATGQRPRRDMAKERFWREVVAEQAESGLSVRICCLRREVSEALFQPRRRELARRDDQAEELPRFAEVVVADRGVFSARTISEGLLYIHLENGRVEVPAGLDRETLRDVLWGLRGGVC